MISRLNALVRVALGATLLTLGTGLPVLAQQSGALPGAGGLGAQNLRPYHFLFFAYALAWILVLGWVISIGRRISRLSERLEK